MSDHSKVLTRRDALVALASSTTTLVGCAHPALAKSAPPAPVGPIAERPASAQPASSTPSPPALAGGHTVVPLPFKSTALNGISEKMIVSHHDNNYAGAVKNLNKVEQELSQITADTPAFVVAGLRQSELTFRNSKTLHEAYFGNLGGDGKRSGTIERALTEAYGTSARWEEHFRATGAGLGGGSGWVILALELDTAALRTCWSGNHTQVPAAAVPLLVMDMYEHAYQMDFGAAAAKYIEAFFGNVRWDEVNRRYERASAAAKALRG
ncbi:MAG TPA: Fe-Mn family superoxide dismutase [Polyangiaceae bacterium]|nr:Fe-Mn family superoxide dismutase [Polyangiaceae bacterium]